MRITHFEGMRDETALLGVQAVIVHVSTRILYFIFFVCSGCYIKQSTAGASDPEEVVFVGFCVLHNGSATTSSEGFEIGGQGCIASCV